MDQRGKGRDQVDSALVPLVQGERGSAPAACLRTLATPEPIRDWSLTSLREKLIKIGAKVVSQNRYVAFQMAEVAIPRHLFADILRVIGALRAPPIPATAT